MLEALKAWWRPAAAVGVTRWVVLDVESSGLDPHADRLLAIAAIAVQVAPGHAQILLGDSFEVLLRQPDGIPADKDNILVHGIGLGAQRGGVAPDQALAAFEQFVAGSPLVAFHAAFDRALLERACRACRRPKVRHAWLDLEPLAAVLHPQVQARALDDWLAHFSIRCAVRHQAAADTLATAELLLKLWPAACRALPRPDFKSAVALAAQRRWLTSA